VIKPRLHPREEDRLNELRRLQVLDTPAERAFDELTAIASWIFQAPTSAISLVDQDRQWFKARRGIEVSETPREESFCAHTILSDNVMVVEDAKQDSRFHDNPNVSQPNGVRFYAAAPVYGAKQLPLGTICVVDFVPRQVTPEQLGALRHLGNQVSDQLRLRLELLESRRLQEQLEIEKERLKQTQIIERENHRFLQTVLDQLPVAVFCKDATQDLRFSLWSRKCEDIWGLFPQEVLGRTDFEILPQERAQKIRERDEYVLQAQARHEIAEEQVETRVRGARWLRTVKVPVFSESGQPQYVLGISEDITEKKEQRQLIEAQQKKIFASSKMSALGEMAAGIAHEINNPLAIILGRSTQLIEISKYEEPNLDLIRSGLEKIGSTAERIAKIVRGLKKFSRHGEAEPILSVSVFQIIADTLELCDEKAKNLGIHIRKKFDESQSFLLECRPVMISQVLLNLLNNACDAIGPLDEKWIEIEVSATSELICIKIRDSGPGIAPHIVERMMEPFFSTKAVDVGTGLGLSISKNIIEEHGGRLQYIANEANTCFQITLPLEAPPRESSDDVADHQY